MAKKTSPVVTVVILGWKKFELLKRAIKSVLDQTFKDFEILVAAEDDDELFPKIQKICKDFNDERIRVIRRERRGISSGRTCGIRNARGEYIAFLDEDDEFLPNKLEKHVSILEKTDDDVILTYAQHWGWDRKNDYRVVTPLTKDAKSGDLYEYMLRRYFETSILFQIWDAVIKKKYVEDMKFDPELFAGEDDFLLLLAKKGKFVFIPEILHIQNLDAEFRPSTAPVNAMPFLKDSGSDIIFNKQAEVVYKKHLDYIKEHGIKYDRIGGISKSFLTKGARIITMGDFKEGRRHILYSIKLRPSLYTFFVYLLSFFGKNLFIKALKTRQKLRGGLD
jgi:glycosyltransferase involved in cell wall biosynthesis